LPSEKLNGKYVEKWNRPPEKRRRFALLVVFQCALDSLSNTVGAIENRVAEGRFMNTASAPLFLIGLGLIFQRRKECPQQRKH
jgi:hypothetical protein